MKYSVLIFVLITFSYNNITDKDIKERLLAKTLPELTSDKIPVLNFATFHMGTTSDASSVAFDEYNKKNQADAQRIARLISRFEPTIVCVEYPYEKQDALNAKYSEYLENPKNTLSWYGEIGLIAFPLAQMSGLDRIYGIDHKMSYNYNIGREITNKIDSSNMNAYYENPFKWKPELNKNMDSLDLTGKLELMNHPEFLDFLIVINADILALAGSEDGYEGADEAAKYYQRNLRIYSNLNRIPMTSKDRVFILSGGSHTAFLREFIKRSQKFEMVDTFQYLN